MTKIRVCFFASSLLPTSALSPKKQSNTMNVLAGSCCGAAWFRYTGPAQSGLT